MGDPRNSGVALSAASGSILSFSILLNPVSTYYSPCLFYAITELPSPSCVLTRVFIGLGYGDISEGEKTLFSSLVLMVFAWGVNPVGPYF